MYCLGGGEDGPQVRAARTLGDDGTLPRRVAGGAVVLAVCAGFQVVDGPSPAPTAMPTRAWGSSTSRPSKGPAPRAGAEVVAEPEGIEGSHPLTGFENHGGRTTLGEGAVALARVTVGIGNGDGGGTEGAVSGPCCRDLPPRAGAGSQSGAG